MTDSTASTAYFSNLNSAQLKALAVAPKVTSILSIAGCSYMFGKILICDRCRSSAGRIKNCTYTNLLLGLSFADFVTSIAYFLSTWPIPKDNIYSDIIWGEAGNQITCNIQGFMVQFGCLSSIMYTCSINLHFFSRHSEQVATITIRENRPHPTCCKHSDTSGYSYPWVVQNTLQPDIVVVLAQSLPHWMQFRR